MALTANAPSNGMANARLVHRTRKMSLVAEESSFVSQYQPNRRGPVHLKRSKREDDNTLYMRRMEKLKKTLAQMGDQPRPKLNAMREFSIEQPRPRYPQESTVISRNSTTLLSPLKLIQRSNEATFTSESDVFQRSFRSGDGTMLSSRDGRTTADAQSFDTPVTAGIYQQKHRSKALFRKKKRQGFLRTLPKLSKFVCILIALWKKHQHRVKEFLESSVDLVSVDPINDLLFDKTDYTADKQARISSDTKRILSMLPELRTPKDIKYVEVALRNYPAIAAYPVSIQTLIASRAWYEIYHGRRIIIRQGHVARCFYFILSGKAVITQMEDGSNTSKTVCYLTKGDSFGELAIINKTCRTATVITEGTVELLVITDEDYEEVFTSGELTEKYFPFLKTLNYLKDWPIEYLTNNRPKAYITYFKRGSVMCGNTKDSNWIYIIKSGSVTVLKKLKEPQQTISKVERKRKLDTLKEDEHFSYLCNAVVRESKKLSRKQMAARYQRLRELHLGAHVSGGHVTAPGKDAIEKVSMANATGPTPTAIELVSRMKKMSGWQMGPMVTRTGLMPLPPVDESRVSDSRPISAGQISTDTGFTHTRRVSVDSQQLTIHEEEEEVEPPDSFVTVQTLIKGDSYGIAELIHGPQTDFSLVSNGAECIMIEKKMYWEHAVDSQPLMRTLKNEILPYPVDEKMQTDLGITLNWAKHKQKVFHKALRLARKRKSLNKMKAKGMSVFVQR